MKILRKFTSKRNDVFLAEDENGRFVIKRYAGAEDAETEKAVYDRLQGSEVRTPRLLSSDKCELKLSYVEGVTFTELLERQERAGSPDFEPWEKLVNWLCCFYGFCHRHCPKSSERRLWLSLLPHERPRRVDGIRRES